MIKGIGIDLVEIERIRKVCAKEAFLLRFFTINEIEMFQGKVDRIAGNFAVKEAVSKVFGTGFRQFGLKDIEVLRDPLGKPYISLYGPAKELADDLNITQWHVSISNTKSLATAYVIGEEV